jgi:hypothetical protein
MRDLLGALSCFGLDLFCAILAVLVPQLLTKDLILLVVRQGLRLYLEPPPWLPHLAPQHCVARGMVRALSGFRGEVVNQKTKTILFGSMLFGNN